MRLPRMTTRRWMVAVTVVAVALAAGMLFRRHRFLRERADHYEKRAREGVYRAAIARELALAESEQEMDSPQWAAFALEAKDRDWDPRLLEKYRRAARYPWLLVEPDPPEPE
jgi:hypothetical protein